MPDRSWWKDAKTTGPIKVTGGIKAKSNRGDIGRTWWSRRFVEVLESLGLGGRLNSGKRYARAGQVLSLTLQTSLVTATIQGSRDQPYRARIAIKAFDGAQWARIEKLLAGKAIYAAKLLAGEMPLEIEEVFAELDLRLFPTDPRELTMDCSCPDWEVPCKHLAAVCYLLAESFDADPFKILAWRGRNRDELLDRLRELRSRRPVAEREAPEPRDDEVASFWSGRPPEQVVAAPLGTTVDEPGAVLNQVSKLMVGDVSITELLKPWYRGVDPNR
ncbi:SWIM zinc finger family protein [Labedaea rhizosphaerae]|uniref:Putative Zn finger protein n=1 Tax=Labedaea rhizosphaerae TaxID=598644 RepID=A0A4V3D028_LABRH|nr:SWIM zinc finger family protein [Labedaea rhizosphaerae]TDQ04125.1 putative Zn finger protein [Labedaea rhizosphaerae]